MSAAAVAAAAPLATRRQLNGLIMVKELVLVDPDQGLTAGQLVSRQLPRLPADTPLYQLLRLFESGGSHMVALTKPPRGGSYELGGTLSPGVFSPGRHPPWASGGLSRSVTPSGQGLPRIRSGVIKAGDNMIYVEAQQQTPQGVGSVDTDPMLNPMIVGSEPEEDAWGSGREGDVVGIITIEDVIEEVSETCRYNCSCRSACCLSFSCCYCPDSIRGKSCLVAGLWAKDFLSSCPVQFVVVLNESNSNGTSVMQSSCMHTPCASQTFMQSSRHGEQQLHRVFLTLRGSRMATDGLQGRLPPLFATLHTMLHVPFLLSTPSIHTDWPVSNMRSFPAAVAAAAVAGVCCTDRSCCSRRSLTKQTSMWTICR